MRRWQRLSFSLLMALVSAPLCAEDFQQDLKERRARVAERIGPESILILWSAPPQTYSRNIEYEYRQDSNLYYLTGIDQRETILVLMPGNKKRRELLFILPRNALREHWDGHILSREQASARSGVGTVYLTNEFEPYMDAILSRVPYPAGDAEEFSAVFGALEANRARVFLVLEPRARLSGDLTPALQFASRLRERFVGFTVQDAADIFRDFRQVKTPYERKVLERSVEISSEAHLAGMRTARPGVFEYEVEAAIEYVHKVNGALGWGYPSIVGSGPNATILHYHESRRRMEAGELLLVDAAANYEYLTGDITRTYPVGGTFTATQKDVYRVVLAAQEEAMKVARAGVKTGEIHQKTVEVIKEGLLRLGLITNTAGDQYRTWYTHGSVHFIGMDVHDIGNHDRPLEPGMAFVIEPGIYVREGALENLPETPENKEFIKKARPAFEKYRNIGIRIEDSFLLTENGLKRLSAKVPRTIDEIESFLHSRKPSDKMSAPLSPP